MCVGVTAPPDVKTTPLQSSPSSVSGFTFHAVAPASVLLMELEGGHETRVEKQVNTDKEKDRLAHETPKLENTTKGMSELRNNYTEKQTSKDSRREQQMNGQGD